MYEFCFSLPYGGMLLLGGVAGYLSAGSTVSLAAGGGSGALVLFLGMQSLKEYNKCKSGTVMPHEYASATRTYTMFSLIISGILTYVMGDRYLNKNAKFSKWCIRIKKTFLINYTLY